jgi:hypothetical protein
MLWGFNAGDSFHVSLLLSVSKLLLTRRLSDGRLEGAQATYRAALIAL